MRIPFLTVAMACTSVCIAANAEHIELRSGALQTATLDPATAAERLTALDARTHSSHFVVELKNELGIEEREAMAARGLRLLTCLGPRTWIASSHARMAGNLETIAQKVNWAGELKDDWKLHPWLAAGKVPTWTVDNTQIEAARNGQPFDPERLVEQLMEVGDPKVVVYALAHRDVELADLKTMIPLLGNGEVLSEMKSINGVVIRLPYSEIPRIVKLDEVMWLEPALPQFKELNDSNRTISQVTEVQDSPYGLDGTGVTVMVYDGGFADSSHPDFSGRLTVRDSSGQSSHGTHVCGTVGGDGTNSGGAYKGMAPNATIESYGFEQDGGLSEGFLYTDPGDLELDYSDAINNHGAVISNNSIGTNTAPNGFPCEWTGDYGVTSNLIDSVVRGDLGGRIRIVWANGNERQTTRCGDLYNTTAPPACAKNHITIGALNSNDDSVTSFTSWGPADDGRIKPDLSGPGCQSDEDGGVTSTTPGGGYSSYCGTSMSSPTVCGIGALIIQDWRAQFPGKEDLWNSSLKALLATTGADLGNPGPDCQHGFGTVRARNAIDALRAGCIVEAEVADSDTYEFLVIVGPDDDELKITLAWDDAPASPLPVNALVNDLDLVVLSPSGERVMPWTIDPSDPGAPATQDQEDHLNNMEQVTVASPASGAWRIQIRGFAVPVGPQQFSVVTTPEPTQCSSTGIVGLDRGFYPLDSQLAVSVVDCDLNTDDNTIQTIEIMVSSDDEPSGEMITLVEEDPAASVFSGGLSIVSSDAEGSLLALDGSTIRATYIDAEDSDGNTDVLNVATAVMDGLTPTPQSVEITEYHPDGATISVTSSEPVRITIRYGSTCASLNEEIVQNSYSQTHDIRLSGLFDNFTYAFSIEIEDQAGNSAPYDNGGDCWEFTVPDALDLFAEQYSSGVDVDGYAVRFEVIESADYYIPCATQITQLPVNPAGGNGVSLGDDTSTEVSPGTPVSFYGSSYSSFFINSNGSVTFDAGSTEYNESMSQHFDRIGVSALWDDLNPSSGGSVSWKTLGGDVVVTFEDVHEYGDTGSLNTFQVIFGGDQSVTMAWLGIDVSDAIVGLSPGTGTDPQFIQTDFSEASQGCLPRPPSAFDMVLSTNPGSPIDIELSGSDDGQPNPPGQLSYVLVSLPQWPLRDLATGERITSSDLPYTLPEADMPLVRYEPAGIWEGNDEFEFLVDDGGTPPEGGPSAVATVSIGVASGPQVIYGFAMDTDPGWTMTGDWAFGQPTGQGGDPSGGATGSNVIGYNLNGAYPNNMSEYALTTQSFDCSELTDVTLRFQRWLGVESASYDHARLQVSIGNGAFTTIWENPNSTLNDSSWSLQEYDISSLADGESDVRIRWTMGTTDSSVTYEGWNIDDVEIFAVATSSGTPGDLNGDGFVNGEDVGLMLASWGNCSGCPADFNGDGVVDGEDFGLLLSYWTPGGGFAPMTEGPIVDSRDGPTITGEDTIPAIDQRMHNRSRIAPREHDGLLIATAGYVQHPKARLEIELVGGVAVIDHDLLLVNGLAELSGELQIRQPELGEPEPGIYVVLLADEITGDFDKVTFLDRTLHDMVVCTTEHAVLVKVGNPREDLEKVPGSAQDVLDFLDGMDRADLDWDLDGNGKVDHADLSMLLGSPACSP